MHMLRICIYLCFKERVSGSSVSIVRLNGHVNVSEGTLLWSILFCFCSEEVTTRNEIF